MLIIIDFSKSRLSYKKIAISATQSPLMHKIGGVPSPRNPAVYKTNLTNRHEKISNVCCKVNDYYGLSKFLKIFLAHIGKSMKFIKQCTSGVPVLRRRHTGACLEEFIEHRLVRKVQFEDNLLDGLARIFEQVLRFENNILVYPLRS